MVEKLLSKGKKPSVERFMYALMGLESLLINMNNMNRKSWEALSMMTIGLTMCRHAKYFWNFEFLISLDVFVALCLVSVVFISKNVRCFPSSRQIMFVWHSTEEQDIKDIYAVNASISASSYERQLLFND